MLSRLQMTAAALALLGIIICGLFALADLDTFLRAYLVAFVVWLSVPLGCLLLLLTYHLAGGPWGRMLGEPLEAGARTLPLMALLGLPLLIDLPALFSWARLEVLASEELIRAKAAYLDPDFFRLRALIYLVLWAALALVVTRHRVPLAARAKRPGLAALGLVLVALSAAFATIDWIMSLDPTYASSIFGLVVIAGHLNAGFGFAALVALAAAQQSERDHALTRMPIAGLGGLLLAAIVVWAYFAGIEYVVVWSGNLPHNAAWYLTRGEGVWLVVLWLVAIGHFVLPGAVLLSRRMRGDWRAVMCMAGLVLAAHLLHLIWQTAPAWGEKAPSLLLISSALIAIGGLWLLTVSFNLRARDRIVVAGEKIVG